MSKTIRKIKTSGVVRTWRAHHEVVCVGCGGEGTSQDPYSPWYCLYCRPVRSLVDESYSPLPDPLPAL